ncbi:hypothetical protein [Sporolactobacillus sp. KGMB 08714]|uniref:hypothetical protein n=1 Tax=Sporolactobacillus sp. KGMB 08714 TaxID=3064704 RepID=UPI002FBD7CA8
MDERSMAQMIKIRQCVSRYQIDLPGYAGRFVWLKSRRLAEWKEERGLQDTDRSLSGAKDTTLPADPERLFYEWLFEEQLDWATRTADKHSPCPNEVHGQNWLKKILRAVNDVSFVLYCPVLLSKSAAVQLDSLLITNDTIWCIKPLIGEEGSVFQEVSARKWREILTGSVRERLNPLISLVRTESVVSSLMSNLGIKMKTAGAVFAPESYIEFVHRKPDIRCIDLRSKRDWYEELSAHSLMLKKEQITAAETLLAHSETDAEMRFQDAGI